MHRKPITSFAEYMAFVQEECDPEDIILRGQQCCWSPRPKIARPDVRFKNDRLTAELEMFEQFKREARPFLNEQLDDWELLALVQHNGLSTRLMEWTKNPLAALWFAVEKVAQPSRLGMIWVWWFDDARCCRPKDHPSPFSLKETMIYRPSHVHQRIAAQRGWFTVHPHDGTDYLPVGRIHGDERYMHLRSRLNHSPTYGSILTGVSSTVPPCILI